MTMEFIDLKAQFKRIETGVKARLDNLFSHGQYIMGPEIQELESTLAAFVGVKHCIGVSSGTDALLIAMMALGIKPGDEVITTPFSFIATAETILNLGATPVFVDILPDTYLINPDLIEKAITPKTSAIMPVSLYGQCPDFSAILPIAEKYDLPVIEDGAQSFGATHHGGLSCGITTVGCTSFFPAKPLGCYGDGGACFTDDDQLAVTMKQIRIHGQDRRYHHVSKGINGRLDTMQAAILLEKFKVFPEEIQVRQKVAARYDDQLTPYFKTPVIAPGNTSVYGQYTIEVDERNIVRETLKQAGVPTCVHYPIPFHQQPVFSQLGYHTGDFQVAESVASRVLSLPMHGYLREADQNRVIDELTNLARETPLASENARF